MTLRIISSDDTIFEGAVESVTLPGTVGSFTVLKNHASLVSTLTAGIIAYSSTQGDGSFDISGGVVDVDNNIVSVCVY